MSMTTPWPFEPVQITSDRLLISTLKLQDIADIPKAIHDPSCWFGTAWGINTEEKIVLMLQKQLEAYKNHICNPLVYRVRSTGEVAGITRFMRIEAADKTLEIGGTWVAPKWRKTFVNTEVKFLLLEHCFEKLGAIRVEFRIDTRNKASQEAVKRIGAVLEGILRHRQILADGSIGDGCLFTVISPEWPETKDRLQSLRARQ